MIFHHLELTIEPFFIEPPLIVSFFLLNLSYQVRRFFTNGSLSNNYSHRSIFSFQSPPEIEGFFIGDIFDFFSPVLTELKGFFLKTISLLLLHLPYKARKFFVLIKALVFLLFLL